MNQLFAWPEGVLAQQVHNPLLDDFEGLIPWITEWSGVALLAGLVLIALRLAWLALPAAEMTAPQYLLWLIARTLTTVWWRTEFVGREHLDSAAGAVIASNHRSSVDPFFLQASTARKMHWMVAREFCEHWAFGWFLRICEVIPVGRGGVDTNATRTAIRLVAEGGLVGMFPEGRINMTERLLLPLRPGAALVALKARVPLIPCYIHGSPYRRTAWSPFFMPARVRVTLGAPLDLSPYFGREQEPGVLEAVMRLAVGRIAELAGQPEFQPEFAGRSWKPTAAELAADMDEADRRRN